MPNASPLPDAERLLGRVAPAGGVAGAPALVVVGGIHGNEPAGPAAIARVLARLEQRGTALAGELVALSGNLPALAAGRRYVHRDLNRLWNDERLAALRRGARVQPDSEDIEQLELLDELVGVRQRVGHPPFVLDLHTTSGDGYPFATMADSLRNRRFAAAFPVPVVVGLEEALEGTLLDLLERHGWTTLAFEGGQHDDPRSIDTAEAAIWLALAASGVLPAGADDAAVTAARATLRQRTGGLPRVLEVCHRHGIRSGDEYRMEPGFVNFQPIRRGQLMARDRHGEVRAPRGGRVLMPLYQQLGDDGYFVVQELSPFWLRVSTALRQLGVDRRLTALPGIRPVAGQAETIAVASWLARLVPPALFRLLGYRRHRDQREPAGRRIALLTRRPPDPLGVASRS